MRAVPGEKISVPDPVFKLRRGGDVDTLRDVSDMSSPASGAIGSNGHKKFPVERLEKRIYCADEK